MKPNQNSEDESRKEEEESSTGHQQSQKLITGSSDRFSFGVNSQ